MFKRIPQTAALESPRTFSSSILMTLVIFAGLVFCVPAKANTYQFAIPTTLIQTALDNALTATGHTVNLYAFYDFYLRPAVSSDLVINPATNVANYSPTSQIATGSSIVDFASPIPTNANGDKMTAVSWTGLVTDIDGGKANARYTYASGDSKEALITTNPNITGKSYEAGLAAEYMPSSTFYITINTPGPLTTPVRFEIASYAYRFADVSALSSGVQTKLQIVNGFLDLTGTEVPEPGVLFTMSAGLGLLALVAARRRRTNTIAS